MAARVTDHLWDVDELLDALLAAEPCTAPAKKPIGVPVPDTTARPLPNGRGFLRIVPGASGPKAPGPAPGPAPVPPPAPVAPAAAAPSGAPAVDDRQLDLFAWKPRPLPPLGTQLSLF